MFFKKKKNTTPETKKPALLLKENIRLDQKDPGSKEAVIRMIGSILQETGYVNENYVEGMLKREESFPTNLGNGIAIPHGVLEVKKEIKNSGLAVLVFPDGVQWNDETVKLVVGIAGAEEEHLDILSNIAMNLSTPDEVEKLVAANSVDYIYDIFMGNVTE